MSRVNLELKSELIRRFGSQIEAALSMGIREGRLSYIVRGHAKPSAQERKALEHAFGEALVERLLQEKSYTPASRRRGGS